jgi:hypothetical protein
MLHQAHVVRHLLHSLTRYPVPSKGVRQRRRRRLIAAAVPGAIQKARTPIPGHLAWEPSLPFSSMRCNQGREAEMG